MKELGELVRGARKQKGVTLDQASAETRIRRQYLDAIEDGDFRIFPGGAYATGFLRNYASYLGLNADEILQTYHAISPRRAITIAPATTVGTERLRRRARRRTFWLFAGVFAVILCAFLVQRYNAQNRAAKPPQTPIQTVGSGSVDYQLTRRGDADQAYHTVKHAKFGSIRVRALQTAWIHVKVDGQQVYWGPVSAGVTRHWKGGKVAVSSRRGASLKVWVDGKPLGRMSHGRHRHRVIVVARPHRWLRSG